MKIILFGGGKVLLDFCNYLLKKNNFTKVYLITSQRHAKEVFSEENFLDECKKLKSNDYSSIFDYFIISDLDSSRISKFFPAADLAISIGSAWIFKKRHIIKFRNLFNLHSTALPQWGGGGGSSWRIMCSDKFTAVTLHKIDEGIDTGNIILQKKIELPNNSITPLENDLLTNNLALELLKEFIEKFISKSIDLNGKKQNNEKASYFPRLNSNIHACINWSWNAKQISSFINAFDDPYVGAFTSIAGSNLKIHLKKSICIEGPNKFHPYQSGIIYRIEDDGYYICAVDGSLFVKDIKIINDKNILSNFKLKIGDRLYSSLKDIEKSLKTKISYNSEGLIIKNYEN